MTAAQDDSTEPVRLLFEMTRDDNPRLYDDLVRFNKGTKRVNRLRFLAHEGSMAQQGLAAEGGDVPPARRPDVIPRASPSVARQTSRAFDEPQDTEG